MMAIEAPRGELVPFAGREWTAREAAHLLGRAQFGYTSAELDAAVTAGLNATLDRLFTPADETPEFTQADASLKKTALATGNIADLKVWWLYRMWASANPVAEKVALLWHNHFATSQAKVQSVPQMLAQNQLIREHGLGDFRHLLHGMSRDTAMLVWLDGNANRKRHPNENFAREVMELFALGVGNYTEKDIQEAARAFSGWHVREGAFWFNTLQHDSTPKTVFGKTGNFDGAAIVDLCLQHPACPRFLALKLLRTYVTPDPTPAMRDAVAERIVQNQFQMAPVLRELLASQMFFADHHRRCIIKSPLDLVVGSLRMLAGSVRWPRVAQLLANLGQDVFAPPSVKGWEGGRLWINSSTILLRTNFATELATGDSLGTLRPDVASLVNQPLDQAVIRLERLAGTDAIHAELQGFSQQTGGEAIQRLRATLQLLMSLPEYQLH